MAPRRFTARDDNTRDTRTSVHQNRDDGPRAHANEKRVPQTRVARGANGVSSIDGVPLGSYGYPPGLEGTFPSANNVGNAPPAGTLSTSSGTGSQEEGTQPASMPATLTIAAIAAAFAVIALCMLAGATWLILRLHKRRQMRSNGEWSMVKPSMRTLNISAPVPLSSTGPYSHLSDITRMSINPRPAPTRKPVPKFVVGDDENEVCGTTSNARGVQTAFPVHFQATSMPIRPVRKSSVNSSDEGGDSTPTFVCLQRPVMAVDERLGSISFPMASGTTIYSKPRFAPLRSAPAAATSYPHETLLDEPSPFIQTAPLVPVSNPFTDAAAKPFYRSVPSVIEANEDLHASVGNHNSFRAGRRISVAGTVTPVSATASDVFYSAEMPHFDNRSPPSMPVSALGTAETMTEARFNSTDFESLPALPLARPSLKAQSHTPKSQTSRPPVPSRLSIFPYALPNISVAPSSASTVGLSIHVSSPMTTMPGTASSSATLAVQQTATAASRTSELLDALGLGMHTPAFNAAGFGQVQDLRDQSPHRLLKIAPEMTNEEAENLTFAVDDALKASTRRLQLLGNAPVT